MLSILFTQKNAKKKKARARGGAGFRTFRGGVLRPSSNIGATDLSGLHVLRWHQSRCVRLQEAERPRVADKVHNPSPNFVKDDQAFLDRLFDGMEGVMHPPCREVPSFTQGELGVDLFAFCHV